MVKNEDSTSSLMMRYLNVKAQRKFWQEIYKVFSATVKKEYDEVGSFRHLKLGGSSSNYNKNGGMRSCNNGGIMDTYSNVITTTEEFLFKRNAVQPKGALHVTASSAKKILIMGGTQFIGIFLSRLLVKEGHQAGGGIFHEVVFDGQGTGYIYDEEHNYNYDQY